MAHPEPPVAVEVHQPHPIAVHPSAASVVPVQPHAVPAVASVVLPDGRVVTGYAIEPPKPEPIVAKPVVSRTAVNVALGGIGFLAVCGGLLLLTTLITALTALITALTALITQLVTLAAVIFGGWIALQVFGGSSHQGRGTTVNIRKAVFKRNHYHG
ncbi:hypothetical protein [Streptomyces sp. XY006]|uniref:hypothetical protein n=1 Tax=Streptomyces sp. XY006 TaxID=2021410 RepID=UPI000B8C3AC5|nr:hypothetical protein [Streptomyces sp. XY006]OXS31920.1 hypothetical protein CHR28_28350 [Streptomyces sp. XY006]